MPGPWFKPEKAKKKGTVAKVVQDGIASHYDQLTVENGLALIISKVCPNHVYMTEQEFQSQLTAAYERGARDGKRMAQ